MLFNKNDDRPNERVLYKTKPNMILGCKKAILGVVLLAVVFMVSPKIIQFIGEMQVYLISRIQLPLTRFAAIGFFVVILIIIMYIIWQLLRWNSIEYTLTDTRIIIKSGILSTKKNYMPYTTIQDINTSQSIFAKLFDVGTVSAYSAYDNNQIVLENISDPSKVEDIIFSSMMGYRNFREHPKNYIPQSRKKNSLLTEDNIAPNEYYDEFEPITPIGHENDSYHERKYEYYPEDFGFEEERSPKYEYEPYDDGFDDDLNRVVNMSNGNIKYEGGSNAFSNNAPYNGASDNYSHDEDNYYQNNENAINYNEASNDSHQNESKQVDDSSETVIRRHFDKFKR